VTASSEFRVFEIAFGQIVFVRGFAWHDIAAVEPASEIHELAALGAERTERELVGRDRLLARRATHEGYPGFAGRIRQRISANGRQVFFGRLP
jgi:hypothetical protein